MQSVGYDTFMKLAFEQAQKGLGQVSPNPMVGAVIVKNNEVIARGFHSKSGSDHAEVDAIKNAKEPLDGATLYCNLEPCCHTKKKTPPCVPAIIESGISKVVISNLDPNPLVSGQGISLLRENGIEVVEGVLKDEGLNFNEVFFHQITTKTPFVHLKAAQTLDGKIQTLSGDSKWISNESCRKEAHEMRLKYDAVLVGRGTLNNDNPALDIRMGVESFGKIPRRIIVGNPKKYNWDSKILKNNLDKNIFIVGNSNLESISDHEKKILDKGIVLTSDTIKESLNDLYEAGIKSILVEGGSKILTSFLSNGLFNKLTIFQAPKLIGNGSGIFDSTYTKISEAINLRISDVEIIDNNLKIEMDNICLQE